jgi:hypothetical protein
MARKISAGDYVRPCQHKNCEVENLRVYPETMEQPQEETGTVYCRDCGNEWELGYEPEGIEL